LSWSSSGGKDGRQLHLSISAAGGRTHIRVEERMAPLAGGIFGGIVGGAGGGIGGSSLGVTLGAFHSPLLALLVTGGTVVCAYATARTIFSRTVWRRAAELESLVATLAAQIAGLIAEEGSVKTGR
jgi:hypothetical protein